MLGQLRAVEIQASPGGSPVGECRCGGELLPTRRTLFQIAVLEPRRDVENVAVIPDGATGPRQLVKKHDFFSVRLKTCGVIGIICVSKEAV